MTPDPFTTLGLLPRFALARKELEARHRELSKALHPDRFAGAAPSERRRALNEAINVNHAYRALKDPLQRAQVLLSRLGNGAADQGNGNAAQETAAPEDPMFLMEIMELREGLSEARQQKNLDQVSSLAEGVRQQELAVLDELTQLLDQGVLADAINGNVSTETEVLTPALERGRAALGRLRYFRRFLDEAGAIEDELG